MPRNAALQDTKQLTFPGYLYALHTYVSSLYRIARTNIGINAALFAIDAMFRSSHGWMKVHTAGTDTLRHSLDQAVMIDNTDNLSAMVTGTARHS